MFSGTERNKGEAEAGRGMEGGTEVGPAVGALMIIMTDIGGADTMMMMRGIQVCLLLGMFFQKT